MPQRSFKWICITLWVNCFLSLLKCNIFQISIFRKKSFSIKVHTDIKSDSNYFFHKEPIMWEKESCVWVYVHVCIYFSAWKSLVKHINNAISITLNGKERQNLRDSHTMNHNAQSHCSITMLNHRLNHNELPDWK